MRMPDGDAPLTTASDILRYIEDEEHEEHGKY